VNREVHPEAYDYMVNERGWTPEELTELSKNQIIGSYKAHLYRQGKGEIWKSEAVISESGEYIPGEDYEGYINESYDEAMAREASENK